MDKKDTGKLTLSINKPLTINVGKVDGNRFKQNSIRVEVKRSRFVGGNEARGNQPEGLSEEEKKRRLDALQNKDQYNSVVDNYKKQVSEYDAKKEAERLAEEEAKAKLVLTQKPIHKDVVKDNTPYYAKPKLGFNNDSFNRTQQHNKQFAERKFDNSKFSSSTEKSAENKPSYAPKPTGPYSERKFNEQNFKERGRNYTPEENASNSNTEKPRPSFAPKPSFGHKPAPSFIKQRDNDDFSTKKGIKAPEGKLAKKGYEEDFAKNNLTVAGIMNHEERVRSLASMKRAQAKARRKNLGDDNQERAKIVREVLITGKQKVVDLAAKMSLRVTDVIKELMKLGMIAKPDDEIDPDTTEIIVAELGHKSKRIEESDIENNLRSAALAENLQKRPPVVTIMGHVDHGKTSLLDALRQTNVVAGEAGGITQHIGAYQTKTASNEIITFLDTPGHAAFTEMRSRGAKVTDIVILVVAADDGIMPQTIEAINHAKLAKVPIIVAINKIDKPEANIKKTTEALLSHDLVPEEFGGEVMVVPISAKQKLNLDKLLDAVILQSEVLDLKADETCNAFGTVVEAKMDKNKGVVATVLIQGGTLNRGDIIVAGKHWGKIRDMRDDKGVALAQALPSQPVEIYGLDSVPFAGDAFDTVNDERTAREVVSYRDKKDKIEKELRVQEGGKISIESLLKQASSGKKILNVIIKGDVQGSIEAIIGTINKITHEEVGLKIIHSATGGISPSDITLATASGAMVVGFNVRASSDAIKIAENEGVSIKYYSIIYNLVDDIKAIMSGMLSPTQREVYLGKAEIRQVFDMSKFGKVAGCIVRDGVIKRGAKVRLIRDSVVIHEGKLKTLKRFKEDVQEVKENTECGVQFENYENIKAQDIIECFEIAEEKREI
ncbi:MAG: translation initiation factor IF-2 [Alphaproteobacteria bacterium]|jgi:translation initiation factor IF-2